MSEMSDGWNIALLGATGSVGEAIMTLLQEREFAIGDFYPLASERGAGSSVRVNGKSYTVTNAAEFDWSQVQLAFFVAGKEATERYLDQAADAGCIVIDSSGLFAMQADVPLVVPAVNPSAIADYRNRNLIALADSAVSQLLTAIKPLSDAAGIARINVTNLMSVSRHGKEAVQELAGESAKLLNGMPADENRYGKQIAFNLMPLLADEQGSVAEERQLVEQVRKVLQDSGLPISVSCVQSSMFYGNAQTVQLETLRAMGAEEARDELSSFEDIHVFAENDFPTPVTDASGNNRLNIGCIRNDYGLPDAIHFWSVTDNVHFGGALMAVEIAERLTQELFY